MKFDNKARYYLMESYSGKYVSINGLTDDKDKADLFNISQIRRRFGVSQSAKDALLLRLRNSGYVVINESEGSAVEDDFVSIVSDIEYSNTSILYCRGKYDYDGGVKFMNVVYCPLRGLIREPDGGRGQLRGVEFSVIKVVGEVTV